MSTELAVFESMVALSHANSAETILQIMKKTAETLGAQKVIFGLQINLPGIKEPFRHIINGYPDEYQRIYADHNFVDIDPTVAHCLNSTEPLIWHDDIYSPRARPLAEEARRFGLVEGISIPVHDPCAKAMSMISLAGANPLDTVAETRKFVQYAQAFANILHGAVKSMIAPTFLRSIRPNLTPRECECLRWLALGKSNSVIGDILNISEAAVNFHIANLFKKMKVTSRVQAAALGVSLGIVEDVGALLQSN